MVLPKYNHTCDVIEDRQPFLMTLSEEQVHTRLFLVNDSTNRVQKNSRLSVLIEMMDAWLYSSRMMVLPTIS